MSKFWKRGVQLGVTFPLRLLSGAGAAGGCGAEVAQAAAVGGGLKPHPHPTARDRGLNGRQTRTLSAWRSVSLSREPAPRTRFRA